MKEKSVAMPGDIVKVVQVGGPPAVHACTLGCGKMVSDRQVRESLWGGCKQCENERLAGQ